MTLTRRTWLTGSGSLLFAAAVPRFASALDTGDRVLGGRAFGTYWRLTLPLDADHRKAREAIAEVVGSVNRSMSPYDAGSEITRFNLRQTTDWVEVSRSFQHVVAKSLSVSAVTGGAFDPTVGPIVGRYGFGPIRGAAGGRHTDIETGDRKIRKDSKDLTLDLCGIAKGYALDKMVAALDDLGLDTFVVELGGEVFGRGRRWNIGIEHPIAGTETLYRVVGLEDVAVATSGDRYRSFELGGRQFSHIIDPQAARPIDKRVVSVSVIAPRAIDADAFATGLMVIGPEHGGALAENLKMPTLFLLREGTRLREVTVAGFENHVVA